MEKKSVNDYELDRDIPRELWNNQILKYSKTYKTFKDEDGFYYIKSLMGKIGHFSVKKRKLIFISSPFPTSNKKTYFMKKLSMKLIEIIQQGKWDVTLKFDEKNLSKFVDVFRIVKRRHFSEAHKEKLRANIEKARLSRKSKRN